MIIVDEASMVDDEPFQDLKSFGVKILAVGDHGQLPPIGGNANLMDYPMLRLEKIHRQAESNPIISLSAKIRETGSMRGFKPDGNSVLLMDNQKHFLRGISSTLKERSSFNERVVLQKCHKESDQQKNKRESRITLSNVLMIL